MRRSRRLILAAFTLLALGLPLVILRRLVTAMMPASVISDVEGFFGGISEAAAEVANLAERVWNSIKRLWSFLVTAATLVTGAWDWMVKGVEWFGSQVEEWIAEAERTVNRLLLDTIPKLAEWVYHKAVTWAGKEIHALWRRVDSWVNSVIAWAGREIHDVKRWATSEFHKITKWAAGPINWVIHWGGWLIKLISHPENLVKWILGDLVTPLILFLLRSSAPIFGWLFRRWSHTGPEAAHTIEDILARVL